MPHLPDAPTEAMLTALANTAKHDPYCPRTAYDTLLEAVKQQDVPKQELRTTDGDGAHANQGGSPAQEDR